MLLAFKIMNEIECHLSKLMQDAVIMDFRIIYHLTNEIKVYIKVLNRMDIENLPYLDIDRIDYVICVESEIMNDPFLTMKFNDQTVAIDISTRRRFDNLLKKSIERIVSPIPILSFFSYKGGVGRTTTLISFASYLAMHYQKNIVIVDCDFEAPGIFNYFDISSDTLSKTNGVIEFLNDLPYNSALDIDNYSIRISSKYSGEGTITVIPAGNLSQSPSDPQNDQSPSNLTHFLEALSRTNVSGGEFLITNFVKLIENIKNRFNPDVILMDNRTGFNDIYANLSLSLSTMIVGFFGDNTQSLPGFELFMSHVISYRIPSVVVNSILSSTKHFWEFVENVYEPTKSQLLPNFNSGDSVSSEIDVDYTNAPSIPVYPILRDPTLERLGTSGEDTQSFIRMIRDKQFASYNNLFEGLIEIFDSFTKDSTKGDLDEKECIQKDPINNSKSTSEKIDRDDTVTGSIENSQPIKESIISYHEKKEKILKMRMSLLQKLYDNFPQIYAENIDVNDDFVNRCLFYRDCMNDLLIKDKFLIIGNKGTGKTLIYKAFSSDRFVSILANKYGDDKKNYLFVNVISPKDSAVQNKLIDSTYIDFSKISSPDVYFRRFWFIYVWNSILLEPFVAEMGFQSQFAIFPIVKDEATAIRFSEIIDNDKLFAQIETEMQLIDSTLSINNRKLVISFDQLDYVFKSVQWDTAIAPLINYWRDHQFTSIIPKIFIRTDLFKKLGNITNKEQLKYRSINIEWDKDEMFGFFFKTLFSIEGVKADFFDFLRLLDSYDTSHILKLEELCSDYKIPYDAKYLKELVRIFFGRWADWKGTPNYGESYEWFYTNLKNADLTISLRPFIDLIIDSVHNSITSEQISNRTLPILNQFYYTHPRARVNAVIRHIDDLGSEEGNRDITRIFNYIQLDAPPNLKKFNLQKSEFDLLLHGIIDKYEDVLENKTIDSLRDLMIVNGIISVIFKPGGYVSYSFAFLYKYYLGLKNQLGR